MSPRTSSAKSASRAARNPSRSAARESVGRLVRDRERAALYDIWKPRRHISVSRWAELHRVLDDAQAEPGRWKNTRTPHLIGPMDDFCDPDVETIVLMFAAQCAKSECLNNMMGYVVDERPGPTLIVYPTEKVMKKTLRNRLHVMFSVAPSLRARIRGGPDDLGVEEMHFDRCTFYTGWANSSATMASTPCCYVFFDEVKDFPTRAGDNASPWKLGERRTRTFRGRRKIVGVSTPKYEGDDIHAEFLRTDRKSYWIPCSSCREYFRPDFFKHVKWNDGCDPQDLVEGGLAWLECPSCRAKITDAEKSLLLLRGRWVPDGCTVTKKGHIEGKIPPKRRSGYHFSGVLSPWVTFGELAAEFLDSRGKEERFFAFVTEGLGEPWREKQEGLSDEVIRRREKRYERGLVPRWAKILTAGVDVQQGHYWYAVRAWGPKAKSVLVDHGMLITITGAGFEEQWKPITQLLRRNFPVADTDGSMRIDRMCVDAGNWQEEVLKFCRINRPYTVATKGSKRLSAIVQPDKQARGLVLFRVNTWKDRLWRHIGTQDDENGEWSVYEGVGNEYRQQMTAEIRVKDKRGYPEWRISTEGRPNHLWDVEVLNVLAADGLGVNYLDEDAEPAIRRERPSRREDSLERASWIRRLEKRFQ